MSRPSFIGTSAPVRVTTITVGTSRLFERGVDVALERDRLAAAHAFVGGDDRAGVAIGDAAGEAFGREAAEHHRMDRADARAGEHRRRRFGDHRHVDHHPVAALDAALLEQVREAAGLFVQLAVGDLAALAGLVGFEDQRGAVAMLGEVAVEAIDREVELAVRIPADVEIVLVERPVAGLASGTCSRSAAAPGRARSGRDRKSARSLSSASSVGPIRASKPSGNRMHGFGHLLLLPCRPLENAPGLHKMRTVDHFAADRKHAGVGMCLERGDDLFGVATSSSSTA